MAKPGAQAEALAGGAGIRREIACPPARPIRMRLGIMQRPQAAKTRRLAKWLSTTPELICTLWKQKQARYKAFNTEG